MDDNGDFLVVWSGIGSVKSPTDQSDTQGVFMQRFDLPTNTAGPIVINTFAKSDDGYRRFPTGPEITWTNSAQPRLVTKFDRHFQRESRPRSATWAGPTAS